ncbi:MAG TPA: response regulator transcription factor [Gaiellaceae bacterium]
MSGRILVVEDDEATRYAVSRALGAEGFAVDTASDGESGLRDALADSGYDVVILDWSLPKLTGIDVCRMLRAESPVPIIMLTAKETEIDRVLGLEMGADDYVVKPFSTKELISRVRALIRRQELESRRDRALLRVGALIVDLGRHRVEIDGRAVHLTPTEFRLVELLASQAGKVVTRKEIALHLWHTQSGVDPRSVDVHIRNIRKKIEADPGHPTRLANVRGVGYQLLAGTLG